MDTPTPTFGTWLRAQRLARNWTQERVGDRIGVTASAICRWERAPQLIPPARREDLEALFGPAPAPLDSPDPAPLDSPAPAAGDAARLFALTVGSDLSFNRLVARYGITPAQLVHFSAHDAVGSTGLVDRFLHVLLLVPETVAAQLSAAGHGGTWAS